MEYIIPMAVGAFAGYLASRVTGRRAGRFGLIGYLLLGIAGGFVGSFLFQIVDFVLNPILSSIVTPFVGAVVLIWLARLVAR